MRVIGANNMKQKNPQKHTNSVYMNYREEFIVEHKSHIKLSDFSPQYSDKHEKKKPALAEIEKLKLRMDEPFGRIDTNRSTISNVA
jgi:hypothetical protein